MAHKAGEFYSTKPLKIRERQRKAVNQLNHDIELMYKKPVKDWDFEELRRGRPRGDDGTFPRGSRPDWITDVVLSEIQQRLQMMTRGQLARYARDALKVFVDVMRDDRVDDNGRPLTSSSTKLDAAKYVMDQIIGKSTTKVELSGSVELQNILARVMVNPDGEDAHPVIEGSVSQEDAVDDDE